MYKRLATIAVAALSMPALGLAAFGAAHSVSDSPASQVIIPSRTSSTGLDPRATHDATEVPRANDPAGHDVEDASGHNGPTGAASSASGATTATPRGHSDTGPGIDQTVSHDTAPVTTPQAVSTAVTTTTSVIARHHVTDDHGGTVPTTAKPATTVTSSSHHVASAG
jgi:hypothetical protein